MSSMRHHALAQLAETRQPARLTSSDPAAVIDQVPAARADLGGFLLRLQRTHGNRHVQRLVERGRLRVSRPSDRTERYADRAARALPGGATPPRSEAATAGRLDPDIDMSTERAIRQARGRGQPLPCSVRRPMEQHLGDNFAGVRLHTDARADRLSRSLQALAFTAGNDIFFRRGGYAPGSATGRYLLAHELTHVTQQQSGADQPTVQRYIASVNHPLRDPKAKLTDDYGTYRSLDVALVAGGGAVYKGENTAEEGGKLDQLAEGAKGIKLGEAEDLYLVGHGSQNQIGNMKPGVVAQAVANITPDSWHGSIISLNCWSAYQVKGAPSPLEKLQQSLAEKEKDITVTGPKGISIRHLDWLRERDSPLGMRAVVAQLPPDEDRAYKDILSQAKSEARISGRVEEAFDTALKEKFANNQWIGVENKARFATDWGRTYQAGVVTRLKDDPRLMNAVAEGRVLFGRPGLYEKAATVAHNLNPGEQQVIVINRSEGGQWPPSPEMLRLAGKLPQTEPHVAEKLPLAEPPLAEKLPQTEPPLPEASSWTWLWIAGAGLVGLAALGAGMWLIKRR